ncbi:hypothetical protein NDU88_009798 [Pleurodeles waltl]|uniref:Uncharacterized protein n=1 Tax=Pleurodeles waltl TaxID=8319 RepID=A0AAV7PTG0_PLEWA|nr:hypothetical protein NDU88_009798 [Pleurodeles waltl]
MVRLLSRTASARLRCGDNIPQKHRRWMLNFLRTSKALEKQRLRNGVSRRESSCSDEVGVGSLGNVTESEKGLCQALGSSDVDRCGAECVTNPTCEDAGWTLPAQASSHSPLPQIQPGERTGSGCSE